MNLPKFLYYILTPDGRSGVVVNKTVTFVGPPTHLPQTPDGWQEILMAFERSINLHGLNGNFSLNLGYVRDACRICSDTAYKFSTEKELLLLINQLSLVITPALPVPKYKWVYKYFSKQEINLSDCEDGRDMFKAPLLPGGIDKLIKANWSTVFEFPMNDRVCVNLYHDGVLLDKKANYVLLDGFEIENEFYAGSSFAPLTLINQEGSAAGIVFFSQELESTSSLTEAERAASPNFFAKADMNNAADIILNIKGKIVYQCTYQDSGGGFGMTVIKSDVTSSLLFNDGLPLVQGQVYSHDIDVNITLSPGQFAHIEQLYSVTGAVKIMFTPDSKLAMSYTFRANPSVIKCYKRFDIYKKIIKAITGSEDYAVSALCEEFNSLLVTCGDAIRGLPDAKLKTSLSDFFDDNNSILMAGFESSYGVAKLEGREVFYPDDDSDEVDLGVVTDFIKKPAKNRKCNTYKFGSIKQDIEDVNGKFDPNGNNQFTGPLTKDVLEYNMVSSYKTGPYEIETIRINLEGKTTTDNNSDNDVFVISAKALQTIFVDANLSFVAEIQSMLCTSGITLVVGQQIRITGSALNDGVYDVVGIANIFGLQFVAFAQSVVDEADILATVEIILGAVYELDRPAFDVLEGVPNDSIFNLSFLTPKTRLRRHKRWLAGINYQLLDKPIKFSSGKDNKNTSLKTVIGGVTTDEDADEYVSDPLFLPWNFIFKTIVPVNLPTLYEENPYRRFRLTDEDGNVWRGFTDMSGIAVNEYTPQEFNLLATPNNDLTKLIHG